MQQWATAVLKRVKPIRKCVPAGLCVMQTVSTNSGDFLNPASAYAQRSAEHELVDMGDVAKELFKSKKGRKKKKKKVSSKKGKCAFEGCPGHAKGWTKRPRFRCGACNSGKGAYYHIPCFFGCHRCYKGLDT